MTSGRGFTLLELSVSVLVSAILFGIFFSTTGHLEQLSLNLRLLLERDRNVWLAPLLLSRWVPPAGNNRWNQDWAAVASTNLQLELKTDSDGPGGLPDRKLDSPFESLTLKSSNSNLMVRSGQGRFQPVIKNVALLEFETEEFPLLSIALETKTDAPLADGKTRHSQIEFLFLLRNLRDNLFLEAYP